MRICKLPGWLQDKDNGLHVCLFYCQLPGLDIREVIAPVAALPQVQQGLQFGQVTSEGPRWLRLLLFWLLLFLEFLPLFAVLLDRHALCRTEG